MLRGSCVRASVVLLASPRCKVWFLFHLARLVTFHASQRSIILYQRKRLLHVSCTSQSSPKFLCIVLFLPGVMYNTVVHFSILPFSAQVTTLVSLMSVLQILEIPVRISCQPSSLAVSKVEMQLILLMDSSNHSQGSSHLAGPLRGEGN